MQTDYIIICNQQNIEEDDRVTELKDTTLVEIQAMSKKLDAILNKVG